MSYRATGLLNGSNSGLDKGSTVVIELYPADVVSKSPAAVGTVLNVEDKHSDRPSGAGVLSRPTSSEDGSPHSISWKLTNNIVFLAPLDLNGPEDGFLDIKITSPEPIYENCLSLADHGDSFVLDFITQKGYLYTIQLPYSQFCSGKGLDLTDNSLTWRSIKQPYAFDMIAPLILKPVPNGSLLVSLVDGSLIEFQRSSPFADVHTVQYADQFSPTGLGRLLNRNADRVPGYGNLSVRAIVSLAIHNDLIVTQSANNTLKLWSLSKQEAQQQILSLDKIPSLYKLQPSQFVNFDASGKYVVAYVPLSSHPSFKIFKLQADGPKLEDRGIQYELPAPAEVENWFLADALFSFDKAKFEVIAAWKSNLSSVVFSITVALQANGSPTAPKYTEVSRNESGELLSIPLEDPDVDVSDILKGFHKYSPSTLRQAIAIYAPASKLGNVAFPLLRDIRYIIEETVSNATKPTERNARWQLLRLDRVCRELEAQGREFLALARVPNDNTLWSIRSSFLSIIGVETYAKLAARGGLDQDEPAGIIASSSSELFKGLSGRAAQAFQTSVLDLIVKESPDLFIDRIIEVYNDFLRPNLSQPYIAAAQKNIRGIKDLDATVRSLLDASFPIVPSNSGSPSQKQVTPLGAEVLSHLILEQAKTSVTFLSEILAFLATAYTEGWLEDGIKPIAHALSLLKTASAIVTLGDSLNYEQSSVIVTPLVSALQKCVSGFSLDFKNSDFSQITLALWQYLDITQSQATSLGLYMKLVEDHYQPSFLLDLSKYLPQTSAGTFLSACAYLSDTRADWAAEGETLARSIAIPLASKAHPELSFVGDGIGNGLSAYYLLVSNLCERLGQLDLALKLAKQATRNGTLEAESHLFRFGLATHDTQTAYLALNMLQRRGTPNLKQNVQEFLDMALRVQKAEWVTRELPFLGMVDVVVDILSSNSFVGNMPSYKLLYSWCVHREDFVGAAKSVYLHARKVHAKSVPSNSNLVDQSVALFDLYAVTLNALKLASEKDRWIVVSDKVLTYDDIYQEQKKLEMDMVKQLR